MTVVVVPLLFMLARKSHLDGSPHKNPRL